MMKFEPAFTNISATTMPNRHVMETWLNWISHKLVAFRWLKKGEYCSSLTVYGVVHTFYLSFLCLNLEMSLIWLVGRGGRGEFILFKCYSVTPQASVCSVPPQVHRGCHRAHLCIEGDDQNNSSSEVQLHKCLKQGHVLVCAPPPTVGTEQLC